MASSAPGEQIPDAETRQLYFERGVAISLELWLALTIAVQNNWGGPDSADKRQWFAGAIVDMFPNLVELAKPKPPPPAKSQPPKKQLEEPHVEDIEETLLQVMMDEFETAVDDDSELVVAERIMKVRTQCAAGNFEFFEDLRRRWLDTKGKKVAAQEATGEDQETDWESADDDDDDDGDSDVEMEDAPAFVAVPKEKPPPEVDEDGFTKVTKKRR